MAAVRAVVVACVLALLGVLVWDFVHQQNTGVAGKVDKGETVVAPALKLPRLDAPGDFDLAAYRGKVVVVNFWASWCVDCKLEAKTLHNAAAQAGKDVVFIGVDGTDLSSAARAYMARYEMNYPVVRDIGKKAQDTWGVTAFPETFFIDRSGHVTRHWNGPMTPAQVKDWVHQELQS
jgi:cytochrome c biogenesis protein CcmG/thiol:disulfide interchange protein DsbE